MALRREALATDAQPARRAEPAIRAGALIERVVQLDRRLVALRVPAWTVFVATATLGLWALVIYLRQDLTLVQGDSVGHLFIARRTIDSLTPGFSELGGIWLPLPHLLLLPTIWIDWMWRTGLSGSLVSWLAFAFGAVYVYRIVDAVTRSGSAGFLAAAFFATNPNMLFMQTTAMTESLTILAILGSTYYLLRFAQDGSRMQLVLSALWIFAATLVRYECWALVPFGGAIVALAAYERHRSYRAVEGHLIAWGMIAVYGIVLWLIYSQVIFGDFLNFARGFGTASALAEDLEAVGLLPYKNDPLLAAATYGWSVVDNLGLPMVIAGCLGCGAFLALPGIRLSVKFAALLPVSVFFFETFSLTMGQSGMTTPQSDPADFENLRYGLLMLPAAAIAAGLLVRPLRTAGVALLALALVPQLVALPGLMDVSSNVEANVQGRDHGAAAHAWTAANFPFLRGDQPVVVADAVLAGGLNQIDRGAADWLHDNADDGRILISASRNDAAALMQHSGIPLARFIHEGNKPYFTDELRAFGRYADWIVYQPLSPNDAFHPLMTRADPAEFQLVYDDADFQIFRRVTEDDFGKPDIVPDAAAPVHEDRVLGTATPFPGLPVEQQHIFRSLSCDFNVLTVTTSREKLYAEMICANYWLSDSVVVAFRDQPVQLRITPGDAAALSVETANSGRLDLLVGAVWMEMRGAKPVPSLVQAIRQDVVVGELLQSSEAATARTLFSVTCHDEVVAVATTREVVFAEFACDNLPAWEHMQRDNVQISVTTGEHRRLVVRSDAGETADLEIGRAWIQALRPGAIPTTARLVRHDIKASGADGSGALPLLYALHCADGVASLITDQETYYAELPCARLPSDAGHNGKPISVSVTTTATGASTLAATTSAGAFSVDVDRVWLDRN